MEAKPVLCGSSHGAYSCHVAPGHAGRHYAYHVRDGRVYVVNWADKYSVVKARLVLPSLKAGGR